MNTVEQSIGHYQLKNLLGTGGMGNVFLGYDPRLEREVAIKCVRLDSNIENGDSYLKKEAKVLAKLNHPNIVQLYDIVEQENQLALIMEYVKGVSFKDVIKSQDYTLKQALVWLSEISLGLHSAHQHKIIHRDLKPENVLLNSENKVKIADFGIAKLINSENHSTHNILGSYIAFSPEQASGNKLDCQSDVFSLGIFAYLLLCRKHPFGDSSEPANIISNILSGGVVPPDRENNNITKPKDVEDLAKRTSLTQIEIQCLAAADALYNISGHRYSAHWQASAVKQYRPLLTSNERLENTDILTTSRPKLEGEVLLDLKTTGLSLRPHPLALLRQKYPFSRCKKYCELPYMSNGRFVRVAGLVTGRQRPGSAKGTIFVTLEDETGNINIIVWKSVQERFRQTLLSAKLILVKGHVETKDTVVHIIAGELQDLSNNLQNLTLKSRDFH